jgi:hypothetical protein
VNYSLKLKRKVAKYKAMVKVYPIYEKKKTNFFTFFELYGRKPTLKEDRLMYSWLRNHKNFKKLRDDFNKKFVNNDFDIVLSKDGRKRKDRRKKTDERNQRQQKKEAKRREETTATEQFSATFTPSKLTPMKSQLRDRTRC